MKLLFLRGIPASGKTTFALQWLAEAPERRVRINRDDIRYGLFGKYWDVDEGAVSIVEAQTLRDMLARGKDVVVDATNLIAARVTPLMEIGARYGASITFKDFVIDRDTAIIRDAKRDRVVGAAVIEDLAGRYTRKGGALPPVPTLRRYVPPLAYTPDKNKPAAIIVDIDGTIADHDGVRNPYDTSRYHLDNVHWDVVDTIDSLSDAWGAKVILMTGRDEEFRVETAKWLLDKGIHFNYLFMRPTMKGNKIEDSQIKLALFDQHVRNEFHVMAVFDDRQRVVDMWRSLGLRVFQVAPGDF